MGKTNGRKIFDKLHTNHLIQYPLVELSDIFNLTAATISNLLKPRVQAMIEGEIKTQHQLDAELDSGYEQLLLDENKFPNEWMNSKEREYLKTMKL